MALCNRFRIKIYNCKLIYTSFSNLDVQKLPIIAAGDALYSKVSVLDVCKENSWKYIIRFKKGTIPSLFEDFEEIVELENETPIPGYELARNMEYKGHKMNIVRYKEKEDEKAKKKSKKKKSLVILLLMTLMNLH